jgi:glycosyltransferase involved in cell wall biosynthesis
LLVVLKIGLSDGFDLIHSHSSNTSIPAIIAAASLFSKPVIYDCRDESFLSSLITLGKTPYWFSCADSIDAKLIDSGVPVERIIRTPVTNPPYVSEIQPVTNDETFEICYAGVLREEKGVFLLLDAFETFASNHTDATLTLVGDGPARDELESRIMELDLTERIELTGELNHRQTLRRIGGADVFVLPSESEGLPRTILEAFELETAVIATSVGDIPAYLDNEQTGLMIEPSSQSIINAIERLYTNPALRTELESNAVDLLNSDRWNTIRNRVLGAYENAGDRRS